MIDITNASYFLGGIISGTLFTYFWFKCTRGNDSKFKENGDEPEYDCTVDTKSRSKLVLAVRNDLRMGRGKAASQCSHGAVMAYESSRKKCPNIFADWRRNGQPKIVVKIDSEEEMMELAQKARKCDLIVNIVQDAGRTQIAQGSKTVLAVGPAPENLIKEVTGHLKLY